MSYISIVCILSSSLFVWVHASEQDFNQAKPQIDKVRATDPTLPTTAWDQKGSVGYILSRLFDSDGKISNWFLKVLWTRSDNAVLRWEWGNGGQFVEGSIFDDGQRVEISNRLTVWGDEYDTIWVLSARWTGKELFTIQTDDNTSTAWIAFRNSWGAYTTAIYRSDAWTNQADLRFAGWAATWTIGDLDDYLVIKWWLSGGNVGIWINNPSAALEVKNDTGLKVTEWNPAFSRQITILPANNSWWVASVLSNSTARFDIWGLNTVMSFIAGKVWIWNTSPDYTFDVTGDINLTWDVRKNGVILDLAWKFQDWATSWEVFYNGGNVGIGTSDPNTLLDVAWNASVQRLLVKVNNVWDTSDIDLTSNWLISTENSLFLVSDSDNNETWNSAAVIIWANANGTTGMTEYMRINNAWNVGIWTNNPTSKLDVVWDINFTGNLYQSWALFDAGKWSIDAEWELTNTDNEELDVNNYVALWNTAWNPSDSVWVRLGSDFWGNMDRNTYQTYMSQTFTPDTLTGNRSSYGHFIDLNNNKWGTSTTGNRSYGYGVFSRIENTGTNYAYDNKWGYFDARNASTVWAYLTNGIYSQAIQNDTTWNSTVNLVYWVNAVSRWETNAVWDSKITTARWVTSSVYAYETDIATADGVFGIASTNNGDGGTIGTAYGVRWYVNSDSDDGGSITNARAWYFFSYGRDTAPLMTSSIWVYGEANDGVTGIWGQFVADDSRATNNYAVYANAANASWDNYAVYAINGDNYFAGNIGIGEENPTMKLDIGWSDTSGIRFRNAADNDHASLGLLNWGLAISGLSSFAWNEHLYVSNTWNVWVWTANPASLFEIEWTDTGWSYWRWDQSNAHVTFKNNNAASAWWFKPRDTWNFDIDYNDVDMLTILPNGNVGIGTNNPTAKLQVNGNIISSAPTANNHVTTKGYVDTLVSQWVSWKAPVASSATATYGACDTWKEWWATYNQSDDIIYLCNGTAWVSIWASASIPYASTTNAWRLQLSGDLGGTWNNVQLTNNSVVSANITDGTITANDLAANSVWNSELIDNPLFETITTTSSAWISWENGINNITHNDWGWNVQIRMWHDFTTSDERFTHWGSAFFIGWDLDNINPWSANLDFKVSTNGGAWNDAAVTWGKIFRIGDNELTWDGNSILTSGDSIPGDSITDNTIDSSEIQADTLTDADLAPNSVWNSELIDLPTVTQLNLASWNDNGVRFWSSDSYEISMWNTANYQYGPVTDYSIKTNMSNTTGRGFTWWVVGQAPKVAIAATTWNFQTAGIVRAEWWLQIGPDALFIRDTANRIATDDTFYVRAASPNTYLYSTNTYLGGGSWDTTRLRWNNFVWNQGVIEGNGDVGIGNTNPWQKLDVTGTVRATAFVYSSDERLKTNIESYRDATSVIDWIRAVRYDWKDSEKGSDVWVIAQDVQAVFPEAVKKDSEGYLSVDYSKLVVPLIQTVQDQQDQIDQLQRQVELLLK